MLKNVHPPYNNMLSETSYFFVVHRALLKRGKIYNNLDIRETSGLTDLGRELLLRGPFKRGSTVSLLKR